MTVILSSRRLSNINFYMPRVVSLPKATSRQIITIPKRESHVKKIGGNSSFELKYKRKFVFDNSISYSDATPLKREGLIYLTAPEFSSIAKHIEKIIKKNSGKVKINEILTLFKDNPQMFTLVKISIRNLLSLNKILIDQKGKICWIFHPKIYEKYAKMSELQIR